MLKKADLTMIMKLAIMTKIKKRMIKEKKIEYKTVIDFLLKKTKCCF